MNLYSIEHCCAIKLAVISTRWHTIKLTLALDLRYPLIEFGWAYHSPANSLDGIKGQDEGNKNVYRIPITPDWTKKGGIRDGKAEISETLRTR